MRCEINGQTVYVKNYKKKLVKIFIKAYRIELILRKRVWLRKFHKRVEFQW